MPSLNGVMTAAARNASTGSDLAIAAGQVIARRVALGVAAALDPLQADHAEFGRMVPEKMQAFSAASMAVIEQSSQAGWEITRLAADEVITTTQSTFSIAACTNPLAMAQAQSRFALAWLDRTASNVCAIGLLALGVQQAAMVPIQQTIADNTQRLAR
jgi:hypothetical protein